MQTRKDLYQAHKVMTQRLGLALLQGEPDLPESPMRRHNVAMFTGVLIAVLITAGFGIFGMLKPGGATKLKEAGQLLVEEETGASYVYNQQDGKLQPVANYVSARLILDSQDIKVRTVSSESLAGFARGQKIGISGAPDSLPKPDRMIKAPWTVCVAEAHDAAGVATQYVTLFGGIDVGGTPIGSDAMVVNDGQQNWVLWHNLRMRVKNVDRLTEQAPRKVPLSWINAIPATVDFAPPRISQFGKRVKGPDGAASRVGVVYTVESVAGSPQRWYVLLADGLAPITSTQSALLLQDPASRKAYGGQHVRELPIDGATANAAKLSGQKIHGGGLPITMPRFHTPSATAPLCAVYADTVRGSVKAKLTAGTRVAIPAPLASGGPDRVDQVVLPPGSAALAGQLPGEGQTAGIKEYSLITDQGKRFRLASPDVAGKLGYDAAQLAPVPAHLLRLIPEGPLLDPAAARTPITDTPTARVPGQ